MLETRIENTGTGLIKKKIVYVDDTLEGNKAIKIDKITKSYVEISSGKKFNADEKSQNRLHRAYTILKENNIDKTYWKLYTNDIVEVTIDEILEALTLAGKLQTDIWINE